MIKLTELGPYIIIGGIATLIDWCTFATCVSWLGFHYQIALVTACGMAGTFHYLANKSFTFQCHSKQLGSQLSVYLTVAVISLSLSMGFMACLIKIIGMQKIAARILTTLIMLLPNYLLHKNFTFSKKLFAQPE